MGCSSSAVQVQLNPQIIIWPGSAPCRACLMVARALKLKLDIKICNLLKEEQRTESFKEINPQQTVPTLIDGDVTLSDSKAIMKHLTAKKLASPGKSGQVYPEDPNLRFEIDRLLIYDTDTVYPVVTAWLYPQIFDNKDPDYMTSQLQELEKVLSYLDDSLLLNKYFVTHHLTLADYALMATITLLELVDYDLTKYSNLVLWCNTIKAIGFYPACNIGLEEWKFSIQLRRSEQTKY